MKHFTEYTGHNPKLVGKKKKQDNNIYSFDIETTSYCILDGKVIPPLEYDKLSEDEKKMCEKRALAYEWTFGINDDVYYGRTLEEFVYFLKEIESIVPEKKIIFVHNLSFEFQFIKSYFAFSKVFARNTHKVMYADLRDFNIRFECTYYMSNCSLEYLPKLFNLPIQKLKGDLDYTLIRTSKTGLTKEELKYCENDCLIIYYYILEELKTYETVNNIPKTSTGHVRRDLLNRVQKDYKYKAKVRKAINTDPKIYNLLCESFMGGYTHANFMYSSKIHDDVTSYDFTSSYPYVLVTHRYPKNQFKKCSIKTRADMSLDYAYILVVKFKNVKSKYFTSYISSSKCRYVKKGKYDNGRIIEAEELEIVLTDIDFYLILDMYNLEYEIMESYYTNYSYLPKQFIEFVLEKYVSKTELKGVKRKRNRVSKRKK